MNSRPFVKEIHTRFEGVKDNNCLSKHDDRGHWPKAVSIGRLEEVVAVGKRACHKFAYSWTNATTRSPWGG